MKFMNQCIYWISWLRSSKVFKTPLLLFLINTHKKQREYISCFKKSSSLYPRLWIFRISPFSSWILSQPCGNVSLSLVMVQIHVNFFGLALPWTGSDINSFAPKCLDQKVGVLTPNGFLIRRALGFFFFFSSDLYWCFSWFWCGFNSNIYNFLWGFCSLSTYTDVVFSFPMFFIVKIKFDCCYKIK